MQNVIMIKTRAAIITCLYFVHTFPNRKAFISNVQRPMKSYRTSLIRKKNEFLKFDLHMTMISENQGRIQESMSKRIM